MRLPSKVDREHGSSLDLLAISAGQPPAVHPGTGLVDLDEADPRPDVRGVGLRGAARELEALRLADLSEIHPGDPIDDLVTGVPAHDGGLDGAHGDDVRLGSIAGQRAVDEAVAEAERAEVELARERPEEGLRIRLAVVQVRLPVAS